MARRSASGPRIQHGREADVLLRLFPLLQASRRPVAPAAAAVTEVVQGADLLVRDACTEPLSQQGLSSNGTTEAVAFQIVVNDEPQWTGEELGQVAQAVRGYSRQFQARAATRGSSWTSDRCRRPTGHAIGRHRGITLF